jgi:hypothetical protein
VNRVITDSSTAQKDTQLASVRPGKPLALKCVQRVGAKVRSRRSGRSLARNSEAWWVFVSRDWPAPERKPCLDELNWTAPKKQRSLRAELLGQQRASPLR